LETELLSRPHLLRLIVLHELFHFVWARLGNRRRQEFAEVLDRELQGRARGELGESSEVQKERFLRSGSSRNSPAWRDYVCESFCDTAAWLYSGRRRNSECRLAVRWRDRRECWFCAAFATGIRC
jgi:hypothetical protein